MSFLDTTAYVWLVLPILVFFARVADVTLGTLRIIFISRGKRSLAPLLGFVEVFIWITIVSQIVSHAHNLLAYLAYAAGFAAGAFVGMYIENRLALGTQLILAIVQNDSHRLITHLHAAGYGVTCVDGEGATGPVKLIYTVFPRRNLEEVLSIIKSTHPKAFLSIQDVSSTQAGIFPLTAPTQYGLFSARNVK
jgi:uncharacterized protein YebE (UPF0316 family)